MVCYRDGGCGPYEMYSCNECPASKPDYKKAKGYPPYLDYPKEQKKQTNADHIRAMSDEELAKNLSELFGECAFAHISHIKGTRPPCAKYDFDCEKCWLDWLKQEV